MKIRALPRRGHRLQSLHWNIAVRAQIWTISLSARVAIGPTADRPHGVIYCYQGLFADQCIVQNVLERAEPALIVPPLEEPVAENGLPDLL
jgi:hypothetical protein